MSASVTGRTTGPAGLHPHIRKWVDECIALCQPSEVVWCDGSANEKKSLIERAVKDGTLIRLNQEKLPGCYLHRSNTNDVARTEQCTFICGDSPEIAGVTNNFMESGAAYAKLKALYAGSMKDRTMYVVPFVMGPPGSPLAKVGIELTDSVYVAINMGIMTRMGDVAWKQLASTMKSKDAEPEFTRCLHSVGDCNPDRRFICHFPADNTIWSYGSGYGGNALLGKKCLALRIASYLGQKQGWMAEHMLLMGATSPGGEKTYVAGAFPSACGKTNFAMLVPPEKYQKAGWKITTIGDDIIWMWLDEKGGLRGINPETGYFGVIPGTNEQTNPNALKSMAKDTIYTNAALLDDGDVWWEGKTEKPPAHCIDWTGQSWTPDCGRKAAHPNARFTAPMANNPVLDEAAGDPKGVPISAIMFGGRRSKGVPLVYQAFNWSHGVFVGATVGSETTAAATGAVGVVRRDPMAMLPFIGYNVRDYLTHWFRMGRKMANPPAIFHVNWFRKDDAGKFIWPGFGQNMRVLKWVIDRARGHAHARETLLGWMPSAADIDLDGLGMSAEQFEAAQAITPDDARAELAGQDELFLKLAADMPKEIVFQRELMITRL